MPDLPDSTSRIEAVAQLRADSDALVARGEWDALRGLLGERTDLLSASGDLAALYGEVLLRTGWSEAARHWLEAVAPGLERRGNRVALRRVRNLLGVALLELGRLDEAVTAFESVCQIASRSGDDLLLAKARNNLGTIANIQGRREQALTLYQLAVPAYQRLGSAGGLAECFHNMAITFRDTQALDAADEYERRALEFAREAGSRRMIAMARLGRAEISLRREELSLAEVGATLAATAFREVGDPIGEGDALRLIGVARTRQGKLEAAGDPLAAALALLEAHGATLNQAETRGALAEWALLRGDAELARRYVNEALAGFRQLGADADADELSRWLERVLPGRKVD